MDEFVNPRKHEHLRIVRHDRDADRRKFYFDDIRLIHRALPEIDYDEVDTRVEFMGKTLSFPLLISSMTGGEGEELLRINRHLAAAAEETGIGMAMGSQRAMLVDRASLPSFALREFAPTTLLLGNIGAIQLNHGVTAAMCRELVAAAAADGLYLHLNPLQEAVQPEGETNFRGLAARIAEVVAALDAPVVVKEVGAGISPADAELLLEAGVRYLDVAGAGGTSWSRIESHRDKSGNSSGEFFQDWGLPTPTALRLLRPYRHRATLIASGGIRSGIDMAKAMILGASACGIARPFLEHATVSTERVVGCIHRLQRQFKTAMFLLGAKRVSDLVDNETLISDTL